MDTQLILKRFALMANLDVLEAVKWIDICAEAGEYIAARINPDANLASAAKSLNAAAAALAFYKYTLCKNPSDNTSEYRVGEISVKEKSGENACVDEARELWEQSKISISQYLKDEDFGFLQVKAWT